MVKHIVCFKLRDADDAKALRVREILLSMVGNVPTIRHIEAGCDFLHSGRSYDVVLLVDVDDRDALDAYAMDPYHCKIVKTYMHAVVETSVTVDYEY